MKLRKITAAAGFATGAALALAPLAQADLSDTVDATKAFEIGAQNQLFEFYAALAGADTTPASATDPYISLTNLSTDAPHLVAGTATYGDVTPLESYIYGTNPILAGISDTTGPYNEFNGALTQFYDAYNVYAYAAANGGSLDTNVADYLGSTTTIGNAISGDGATVSSAAQYFFNFGLGDLKGFEGIFTPASTGSGDIAPFLSSEIASLNQSFEFDGQLAGVFDDIVPNASSNFGVGFDTIDPTKVTDTFESLVFGAAGASGDPGSYDVLNGALTEFFNADNVGLFSLLNGGDLISPDLIFGTHDLVSGTGDTVASAISGYLQLGFSDLAGYFLPAMTG